MICKNCGSRNNDYDSVCVNCGTEILTDCRKNNSKKIITFVILCVCIIAMIIASSLIISNVRATEDLEEAIVSKNAYMVNSVYSQAYDKKSKLKKYDKIIANTINEMKDDINSHAFESEALEEGETAVENYCAANWGTLIFSEDSVNISPSISAENWESWEELNSLLDSKSSYCEGLYYKADEEYDDAIESFSLVMDIDSNFDDAKALTDECFDEYVNEVLNVIDEKISSGDIPGAILMLTTDKKHMKELGLNSDELESRLDNVLSEYAKSYSDKAETEFKNHDVNAAIGNIEAAMELAPDNAEYKTKYETYCQYIPFELYNRDNCLNIDETGDFMGTLAFDRAEESNDNSQMNHSMIWYNNNSDSSTSLNAYYNLDGKYDIVKGVLFLPKSDKNTQLKGWFEIYGDGKLLYASEKMTGGVLPKDFSVKVSNIKSLKISFYAEGTGGFLSTSSHMGISNLVAQKDFSE